LSNQLSEDTNEPISSSEEDAKLAKDFQSGKRAAFDKLVVKHKDRVFNLCYWFLGDYQEANDAAQETFIKIFRSLKTFRFKSALSTWFYQIAVNSCKNRLKSSEYRQKKKMIPLRNPGEAEPDRPSVEPIDDSQSPVIELEKKERWMLIKRALDSLPQDQRTVVALRDIQGLSYNEIADITGFNLGTVKSKIARARQGLRELLTGVM
jgi:RNA polymerase sigma-70 factor (ECF subfamily)